MRQWDADERVFTREWKDANSTLPKAGAVIISHEDVNGNDELIEQMAQKTQVLVMTEGPAGAVLYWNGDRRRFRAPGREGSGCDRRWRCLRPAFLSASSGRVIPGRRHALPPSSPPIP